MPRKHLIEAIATLVGFIIGAGILGIPYVVAQAGFLTGVLNIIVIGILILIMNLMLGEVVLRTRQHHQLTGYANKYLGKYGKYAMTISMILGLYGPLVAYILKEGEFLSAILSPIFGGSALLYSLIFAILGSLLIYLGLKFIEESEVLMVLLIMIILIGIAIFTIPHIDITNLGSFNIKNIFLPYGVVLFAFLGTGAIPEMREELKEYKYLMKKAIIIGSLIPLFVYLLFSFMIVGVTGKENVTDGALIGLGNVLGQGIMKFGLIFGILTMATSFLAVGLAIKEMYNFDFKMRKSYASLLTCIVPIILFIIIFSMKINNAFYRVLDITGAIVFSLLGIIVILMGLTAKKLGDRKPEYSIDGRIFFTVIIIIMFVLGFIQGIIHLF